MDPSVARIIDANANRAREALRVLEDCLRFGLDDVQLCAEVKKLRHRLADVLGDELLAAALRTRDIVHDVGRTVGTASEYERPSIGHVALAAAKRGQEAVRALEETVKTLDPSRARGLEQIRYDLYLAEQGAAIRFDARRRFADVKLYVLITEALCAGPWLETCEQALAGGADVLQLREKSLTDSELLARATALVACCRRAGGLAILNDRPDIARLAGADGVHVGQQDLSVHEVRRVAGPSLLVGQSTHTVDQARTALAASPDYLAVGPMFASATKPQEVIAGPRTLAAVRALTSLPLVAIGGINADNLGAVIAAGADVVCVCSAVIGQQDPAHATREIKRILRTRERAGAHAQS